METNSKLYGLDHLRAFAITIVFFFHYGAIFSHPEWEHTISTFGWTGVDLFFVLSGYLIALQLFKEIKKRKNISLQTFFLKRFFRIIPAYLFIVAIYFCLPFARERETIAPLWKYLTFTQNLGLDVRTQGAFSHAWSLCIEEQFYLILPLTLVLIQTFHAYKKSGWLLLVLFLSGFVIRYYCYRYFVQPHIDDNDSWAYWHKAIYYPTYCRLDGLLTGVSIAAFTQYLPVITKRITKYGNLLFMLSICLLAGAYFLCLNEQSLAASVFGFPLVSISYGVMVLAAISPSCFLFTIKSNITATIAALSYSIYLSHKIIIHISQNQFTKLHVADDSNGMLFICIILCIAGAFVMNRTIEKPFSKWRNKILYKPAGDSVLKKFDMKDAKHLS